MSDSRAPALRVQIVLALAGLMALAFLPLFFAVASLARATLRGSSEHGARALARAVAAHVVDARSRNDTASVRRAVESHVGRDGIQAICVFGAFETPEVCAGDTGFVSVRRAPGPAPKGGVSISPTSSSHTADLTVAAGDAAIVLRIDVDRDAGRAAPLVRLVAFYMASFAFALLTFAYFALTRLIVRPIDALAQAADRVASGARTLTVPQSGAREIAELGASFSQMTARLVADDAALRAKIEELTLTTKRLTEARQQLVRSERLASVGRLAAGIAHEIGNPIAALMGMEDLLLDDDLPIETQRDFLERMKKETNRIHTVVRDLLDFARPEEPRSQGGGPAAVALEILGDVAALLRPQRSFKGIAVEVDVEDRELRVELPPDKLTQVILNLAMNAGDAIGSGETSESAVAIGKVTLRARADGPRVRFEVDDTGPGVASAVRDRAFDPFVTTKEVGKGTGLGLAVCRGIVEAAAGEIGIDASYTKGARFFVILPRAR